MILVLCVFDNIKMIPSNFRRHIFIRLDLVLDIKCPYYPFNQLIETNLKKILKTILKWACLW